MSVKDIYTNNQRLRRRSERPPLRSDLNLTKESDKFTVHSETEGFGLWKTSCLPFTD